LDPNHQVYIREKLHEVLFDDREAALKECVLYAPCELIDEGSCLVDTAGTNDSNPTKKHLLMRELEEADTVLCVVERDLSSSDTTIEWLKSERLLERALGGSTLKTVEEQDVRGGAGGAGESAERSRPRWMQASEKPLKLMFMVNHQEKAERWNAREIASRDKEYVKKAAPGKNDKVVTDTEAQRNAKAGTKSKLLELISNVEGGTTREESKAFLQAVPVFSCNPLLFVSLLSNQTLKHRAETREVYQKALCRSNGKELLAALAKCAAKRDLSDRVGELTVFLEEHDIASRVAEMNDEIIPKKVRTRFSSEIKKQELRNAAESMNRELEGVYRDQIKIGKKSINEWIDEDFREKLVQDVNVWVKGHARENGKGGIFEQIDKLNVGQTIRAFDLNQDGKHRKLKLKKPIRDAVFRSFDADALHTLANSTRDALEERAIAILRGRVTAKIQAVKERHTREDTAAASAVALGTQTRTAQLAAQDNTPVPPLSPGTDKWSARLNTLVDKHEKGAWAISAEVKLKGLRFLTNEGKQRDNLRERLKKVVESCFPKLLLGMKEQKTKAQLKTKLEANSYTFITEVIRNLRTGMQKDWKKKLAEAFSKLAADEVKKRALLRTCYSDFIRGVASSMKKGDYSKIGDSLKVSASFFANCCTI
jgi:hypothetical protein